MFVLMIRRLTISTRTDTLFPYTTLCRSLAVLRRRQRRHGRQQAPAAHHIAPVAVVDGWQRQLLALDVLPDIQLGPVRDREHAHVLALVHPRSEEHTSELQSLMRIPYAVFCL